MVWPGVTDATGKWPQVLIRSIARDLLPAFVSISGGIEGEGEGEEGRRRQSVIERGRNGGGFGCGSHRLLSRVGGRTEEEEGSLQHSYGGTSQVRRRGEGEREHGKEFTKAVSTYQGCSGKIQGTN